MINDKGTYKTITTEKLCLRNYCVKRFFKDEKTSYSYGHEKIPENKRNNFRLKIEEEEVASDFPLRSNSESSDSNTSSDSEENGIDENLNRFNTYDIFSNRRKKHENIFKTNAVTRSQINISSSDSEEDGDFRGGLVGG